MQSHAEESSESQTPVHKQNAGTSIPAFCFSIGLSRFALPFWRSRSLGSVLQATRDGMYEYVAWVIASAATSSRLRTLASPIRTSEAQAGHRREQFETQLQSWHKYADVSGMWNGIGVCISSPDRFVMSDNIGCHQIPAGKSPSGLAKWMQTVCPRLVSG